MSSHEFARKLLELPDQPVLVEERFKTGYDEGDIYHSHVETVETRRSSFLGEDGPKECALVLLGGTRRVGGW